MKKPHERCRNIVNKHINKLVEYMNLQDWDIEVGYMDGPNPDNKLVGMQNEINIEYLRSTIAVFTPMYDRKEYEIVQTLAHELAHIITEPLYSLTRANVNPHLESFVDEQREQATERIARIVMKI